MTEPAHNPRCWLASFGVMEHGPMPPCDGQIIKAHLLPRQFVKAHVPPKGLRIPCGSPGGFIDDVWSRERIIETPASFVPACGGPMGNGGHHGLFDYSRRLRVPRANLPSDFLELCELLGFTWFIDRSPMFP